MKQQALEQVASEFQVLEKDKEEIEQWISDVKKELTSPAIGEDQETEKAIRRQKLKVYLLIFIRILEITTPTGVQVLYATNLHWLSTYHLLLTW